LGKSVDKSARYLALVIDKAHAGEHCRRYGLAGKAGDS